MTTPTDILQYAEDYPEGTTLRDYEDPESGLRMLVTKGPFSYCAYVGIRAEHPLAGIPHLRFSCHHGITFSGWGVEGSMRPAGYYWWGWDYGHCTDYVDWELTLPPDAPRPLQEAMARLSDLRQRSGEAFSQKRWTLGEVAEEAMDALLELKQWLKDHEQEAVINMEAAAIGLTRSKQL